MARWIVAGLIVLNLLLAAGIYQHLEPKAQAQIGKRAGNFATVAGQSGGNSIIYVLDVSNGKIVALKNDVLNGKVTLVATRDVGSDMKRR